MDLKLRSARSAYRFLVARLALALLTLSLALSLAAPAVAAPIQRPLAAVDTYTTNWPAYNEGQSMDTGLVQVVNNTTVIISSTYYQVTNTCDDYGLNTYYVRDGAYDAHMRVYGTPNHVPFSCTFSVQFNMQSADDRLFVWNFTFNNTNEAPTGLSLSSTDVDENLPADTLVGTLSTTDPDASEGVGQSFTYSLRAGDTGSFYISGNKLYTSDSFNFEALTSYDLTIRTTDQGSLYYDKAFVITVNDVNETPTNLTLSGTHHVDENLSPGTVVGNLTTTDPDTGNTFTYSLVGGLPGNSAFSLVGSVLQTSVSFNYEAQSSYAIRLRTTDQGGLYDDQDFTIYIDDVNEAPVIANSNPAPLTVLEDASGTLVVSASDPENDPLAYTVFSGPAHGATAFVGATVRYTPTADYNGSDSFVVQVSDGSLTNQLTVNVTLTAVNDPPSFTKGANQTVNEDSGLQSVSNWATNLSEGPANESGQTLDFVVSANTNPTLFAGGPAVDALGALTFTPATNANGSATITLYLHDSGGSSNGGDDTSPTQSFTITVAAVNDAPSFTKGADVTVLEDAGAQTRTGWATSLSKGPSDESGQTLDFVVSGNTNPALFSSGPAVSAAGALTFTPAANANGSATITLYLHDSGGTANSGDDTSPTQTFVINVTAVNDVPVFTKGANQNVSEDAGLISVSNWASAISKGPADESGQVLTFTVSNGNNALFSQQPAVASNGTLTYRPADDAHGSATVSVYLKDSGGTANGGVDTTATQSYTITVNPVNDAPVLDASGSPSITTLLEDDTTNAGMLVSALIATGAGGHPISDVDDNAAEGIGLGLAIIAVDNTAGTWQYSTNGGGAWTDFGTPAPAAARLLAADVNTLVRFVPNLNWHGLVNPALTFRAWDQAPGSGSSGGTADITSLGIGLTAPFSAQYEFASLIVTPVNDAPVLDNTGVMALDPILEDQSPNAGTSVPALIDSAGGNRITDVDDNAAEGIGEGLAVTAVDNTHGVWQYSTNNGGLWSDFGAVSEAAARLLTANTATKIRFVPNPNWSMGWDNSITPTLTFRAWDQKPLSGSNGGTADITSLGTGSINPFSLVTTTGSITVTLLNDAPSFVKGADQALDEGAPAQSLANWASAISPGPADEVAHGQTVHFNMIYDTAPELFTIEPAISPDGNLTYTPDPEAYGVATIIFELQDTGGTVGGGVDTSSYAFFTITLNGVNDAPAFTSGAGQMVDEDTGMHIVDNWATAISRGPANEDWQDLDFILNASQPALFAVGPVIDASGQLSYTLAPNANGVTTVTVQLHDGGGTQFAGVNLSPVYTFTLTVNPVNDPPVNTAAPQVDGLPFVNDTLTAGIGAWNDATDWHPGNLTYTYQWQQADDATGINLNDIGGATAATYTVTLADAGKCLRVRVTATDDSEGLPASQSTAAYSLFTRIGVVNADVTLAGFTASTDEDTVLTFSAADFIGHYTHTSSMPLERIRITGLPLSGTLALAGAPVTFGQEITATLLDQLVYTPTANWNGPDVFHWNATNDVLNAGYPLPGQGAAVTVTTLAVNDPPSITIPGSFSVSEGAVSAAKTWVVTDPDAPYTPAFTGYEFSLSVSHGVITLATTANLTLISGGDGTPGMDYTGSLTAINAALNGVRYQSDADFAGLEGIELFAADHGNAGAGEPQTAAQIMEVYVIQVNQAPVNTLPANFVLERDTISAPLGLSVADDSRAGFQFTLSVDTGTITLATTANLTLLAGHNGSSLMTYMGTLARVNAALASARYRPLAGYHGPVILTLATNDLGNTGTGGAQTDTDAMTIIVNATPLAAPDTYASPVNETLTVPAPGLLANDTDADGQAEPLTAALVTTPSSGQLDLHADGSLVFTPTLNYRGTLTFTYAVSDTLSTSRPAAVALNYLRANSSLEALATPVLTLPGQNVVLTATVHGRQGGETPSGEVHFYADGQPLGSTPLIEATGYQTVTTLGVGVHIITATYPGDANYLESAWLTGVSVTVTQTMSPGDVIQGGLISGTITNGGTLIDTTFYTATVVTGGVVSGTIINYGTLVDVTLGAGTVITGGVLSGTITGDPDQPALLNNVTVPAGSTLSNVIIGPGTLVQPGVTLGDGIRIWVAVQKTGPITNTVTSEPAGIACAGVCGFGFAYGSVVTLTATVNTSGTFDGWQGACTGQGPCVLHLNAAAAQTVTAAFKGELRIFLPMVMNNFVNAPNLIIQSLVVTPTAAQVVIFNQGSAAVITNFWVELYIQPTRPPTGVNQPWRTLASQGLVWGVTAPASLIQPGQSITLTYNDAYYSPSRSLVNWPLPNGASIYAQVDSVNPDTTYAGLYPF